MDHTLVLVPQPVQHPRLGGLIMAMWCETCHKFYYRQPDGQWPSTCPAVKKTEIVVELLVGEGGDIELAPPDERLPDDLKEDT